MRIFTVWEQLKDVLAERKENRMYQEEITTDEEQQIAKLVASRKKKIYTVIFLLVLLGSIVCYLSMDDVPQKTNPMQQNERQTDRAASKAPETNKAEAYIAATDNILYQNPFVEIGKLAMTEPIKKETIDIPAANVQKASANTNLPVIPGYSIPKPNIPHSLPVIPNHAENGNTPAPGSNNNISVQGILTGEDGENMAIMSDGRVVSAGDSYNNDTIAYIGGNGITFEDGHQLGYK